MYPLIDSMHRLAQEQNIKVGQIFEKVINTAYSQWVNTNDQVIDLGAHQGAHLFPLAQCVGAKGKVYGFEPIPHLYKALKYRIKQQKLRQIKLYAYAIGKEKGRSDFQHFREFPAYSGLQQRDTPFNEVEGKLETIRVKQTTLDRIIKAHTPIRLIKIDIEGGELHALMGATTLIQQTRPIIIFENGNQASARTYNYSRDDFFDFFDAMQLSIYTLDGTHFTRDHWHQAPYCWEYYALPNEALHLAQQIPHFAQKTIEDLSR